MTCQTVAYGGDVLHINYGPATEVIINKPDGERWCFVCRKRREFRYIVTAPVKPDWYGPTRDVKCGHCKTSDGDLFPGGEREWYD